MTITTVSDANNIYRVTSASDLTASNITNLFNTGELGTRYTTNPFSAATIYIPQSSIFTDTYLGKSITPGSFTGVQFLLNGGGASLLQAGRTYSLGDIWNLPEFQGKGYWNLTAEHGGSGIGSSRYTDFSYIFGTQNFVLDPSTQIIVDASGRVSLGSYEIRLNKNNAGVSTDDFDFSGGGWGSDIFNYVHASDIDLNGKTVQLIYEGEGQKGNGYSAADLSSHLSSGGLNQGTLIEKFLAWRYEIIPNLEKSGVIVNGKDAVIIFATEGWIRANLEVDQDFLRDPENLEKIVDLVGVENTRELIEKLTLCFAAGTSALRVGDWREVAPGTNAAWADPRQLRPSAQAAALVLADLMRAPASTAQCNSGLLAMASALASMRDTWRRLSSCASAT